MCGIGAYICVKRYQPDNKQESVAGLNATRTAPPNGRQFIIHFQRPSTSTYTGAISNTFLAEYMCQ